MVKVWWNFEQNLARANKVTEQNLQKMITEWLNHGQAENLVDTCIRNFDLGRHIVG